MNKFIKGVIYVAAIASAVAAFVNKRNEERKNEEEEMIRIEKTHRSEPLPEEEGTGL